MSIQDFTSDYWTQVGEGTIFPVRKEKDHYLMHPERICLEDMTEYHWNQPPDYLNCINAKVHGFDKCWVHLTREQKREYMAKKKKSIKSESNQPDQIT